MSITGANNPFSCTPVVFSAANQILQLGTITRLGNEFTFSVGFVWKINGVTYQNTAPVVLTIAEASEGFYRIDNAILNTSNSIELQQGLESETIALQPVVPDTNILLTSWNISGDTIGDEETPLVGTQFKQKNENQKFNPTLGGTTAVITIQPFGQNHYSVGGPVTGIVGFSKALITASPTAEVPYAGKDFYFENKTDHAVTLKNAFSPVDIPFNLGADLVVPTNGIVWLKYNPNTEKMDLFFKSWIEVYVPTQNYFTFSTNTTLTNAHHNAVIWVTATCNITIPSGLRSDFNCTFRTLTGAIATFLTSGTTINAESDGDVQSAKTMSFLAQYTTNNYIISGGGLS